MTKIKHDFAILYVDEKGRRGGFGHAVVPLGHLCLPTCPCDFCGKPKAEHKRRDNGVH